MDDPLGVRPEADASLRRDEKQGRAVERGRSVRVVGENCFLVQVLDSLRDAGRICSLLKAPNATPIRARNGKLVAIKLSSQGDDRGHSGELHGRSTITTERVRNANGLYVGSDLNLKHKDENS